MKDEAIEGRSRADRAEEAARESLRQEKWQSVLARGLEHGRMSGIREDEIVDVVHEWRNENRVC